MTNTACPSITAFLLVILFSCSSIDKASQQRRKETLDRWYQDKRPGYQSRRLSTDLLFQARNDRYLDSFPVLHIFSFDRLNRFTQNSFTKGKKATVFYAGDFYEKGDTVFLKYYQDAHPAAMATYLLKDSAKKQLLYPFIDNDRRIPFDVRYSIFDIH